MKLVSIALFVLVVYLPFIIGGGSGSGDPTPTPEPTATPTVVATPTAAATPSPGDNLLVNGDFNDGWTGWNQANGYWLIHIPITCEPTGTSYAEMDLDGTEPDKWVVGEHDWLWQDVAAPPHDTVTLELVEAHHMREGIAEVTVYGSDDGQSWVEVFNRPEVEAEYGAGKCDEVGPPEHLSYTFSGGNVFYRVEIHGQMVHQLDGWLIGGLRLTVD